MLLPLEEWVRTSTSLPPLQALRAFDAVARLLSFRRAGEELLITQSAVSHHIARLERELGAKLFDRSGRGITLTPVGALYAERIRDAFATIAEGTAELRSHLSRQRVRLSVLPSFAANWLLPRLARFADEHPDIDLELEPTLKLVDISAGEADLAVRYGKGDWSGVTARLLLLERLTPVASPALLQGGPPIRTPADLIGHRLLLSARPLDWEAYAQEVGINLRSARTLQLTDYNIVIQAALDGQGVAIGRLMLLADRLRSGALVTLCPGSVTSPLASHWLLEPRGRQPSAASNEVARWLVREAANDIRRDSTSQTDNGLHR
jgi:LysR family glycine cleavage system transcriptional activator